MSTNSATAAGSPVNSGMETTKADQVQQAKSTPAQRYERRIRKQTERYGQETSVSSGDRDAIGDEDDTFVPAGPTVTQQKSRMVKISFTSASNTRRLRALLAGTPGKLADSSTATKSTSKRKAASSKDPDLDESDSDTQSATNPPKRQRKQTAKERAEQRAAAAKVQEFFPEPRGQPTVWADDRQSLCEALQYFQGFKSAIYSYDGRVLGWLLDNDNDERGYMDAEIVISRFGGGYVEDKKTGRMKLEKSQSLLDPNVQSLMANMEDSQPLILIIGSKNAHSPSKMPHRYNVAGHAMGNCIWSEKVDGMNVNRVRLQNINLQQPSWYAAKDSPLPPRDRDYHTRAHRDTCSVCSQEWPKIYFAGWMCLDDRCEQHFRINGQICTDLTYNPIWWNERTKLPSPVRPPFDLKPPKNLKAGSLDGETSIACWKGMVCDKCGKCNSRTKWDEWKCSNEKCDFELTVKHSNFLPRELAEKWGWEFEGQAISYDTFEAPITKRETEWPGFWRQSTYDIPGGNVVSHFHANAPINRQPGGANDILEALQKSPLGLERFAMSKSVDGLSLTNHFAINYGMPYKYVVAVKSKGFSEAPPVMMNVLNRLSWAGKRVVNDGTYQQFNELLCLGYMEKQSIKYHDDGEKDVGPLIVNISIGGEAIMSIRMKAKFYFCLKGLTPSNYDPLAEVELETQLGKERLELTALFKKAQQQELDGDDKHIQTFQAYEAAKAAFFKALKNDNRQTPPVILTMELRHGDIVVQFGHDLQSRYEHGITPKGKLRFALTSRYVKPENIPTSEHWKGEFHIAPEDVYDGGPGPVIDT